MRILFVSGDASGVSLCHKLHKEGNDVKLYIKENDSFIQKTCEGMVKKIDSLEKGVEWVGKDGLIVFDCIGFGKMQDKFRKDGFSVVGGSELGDLLESDRQYGQKIFSACGIKNIPSHNFSSPKEAIRFLEKHRGPWVIKQNGDANKSINYVGKFSDNRDTINLIKRYNHNKTTRRECSTIDLQKKIYGIEIGVGRYFNGKDWVGPIEIDMEHKDLFNGDIGPKTPEMGTLIWYEQNENNKLFQETLAKMKGYLRKIDFRGDININCIVNEKSIYPLEATARFGYPAIQLHMEFHISPWGKFLKALADGTDYNLKTRKGYGIVVLIATPPFPYYRNRFSNFSLEGTPIFFKDEISTEDFDHIHFEGVARKKSGEYYICDNIGYVIHISGLDSTVEGAREKVYSLIRKIVIPKMYYRTDIGLKFIQESQKKLREWEYI